MSKNFGMGKGLGKGLSALLGDDAEDSLNPTANGSSQSPAVDEIDVDLIDPNPWQPRTEFKQEELDELAQSISNVGIITPLTLRKVADSERYQLIAGERRLRAAKQVGLTTVPAYVRNVSDDKMLAVALIENIQRQDLNPIEEAQSYQRLIDECNLTQETMADQVGKKRSTVTNYLRLLKLPEEIQQALRDKTITMGHARAIMGIEDEETMLVLFRETVEQGYSVRRVEELVRQYNDPNASEAPAEDVAANEKRPKKSQPSEEYKALGTMLSDYFGTQVKLACNDKGKGKITIPFASQEDLERIMEILDTARKDTNA